MTPLRRRMIEDMRVRNLSENTQQQYVRYVVKFAEHSGKFPKLLRPEDVRTPAGIATLSHHSATRRGRTA